MQQKLTLSGTFVMKENKVLLLHRKDHNHWETPGGKVESSDCKNPIEITKEDLKTTAIRELFEELKPNFVVEELTYLHKIEFTTPRKTKAEANKFVTKLVLGTPEVNEDNFEECKFIEISKLQDYNLSPDLKKDLEIIKDKLKELI